MNVDKTQQEFLELYDAYNGAIYRFVLFKISDPDTAWDLTQSCFLRGWEYISSQKGRVAHPKAFLFTIARNLVIDHWRTREKHQTVELDDYLIDTQADNEPSAHDQIIFKEEAEQMRGLLTRLPDIDRELLTLRFVDDLPFSEISRIMGKHQVALRVQAHRTLKKLKNMMTK